MSRQTIVRSPEEFLNARNPDLQMSPEVVLAVQETQRVLLREGVTQQEARIPNEPTARINAYIGMLSTHSFLWAMHPAEDEERQQARHEKRAEIINRYVIDADEVPEDYWDTQRQLARDSGRAFESEIPQALKDKNIHILQTDQRQQLTEWADYLRNETSYDSWYKHWVFDSITHLKALDPDTRKFKPRSSGTVGLFPELDTQSLSLIHTSLNRSFRGEPLDPEYSGLARIIYNGGSFAKLYAEAITYGYEIGEELRQHTAGIWKKYDQTSDSAAADLLANDVKAYRTGWCIGGSETARAYLEQGDFYVYYTSGTKERPLVPRVAIRIQEGEVQEVRGIVGGRRQELEPLLVDITGEKLETLRGGSRYYDRVRDMRWVTSIDRATRAGEPLSQDDIRFIYELDRPVQQFGFTRDIRIDEIKASRDIGADMAILYDCERAQIAIEMSEATEATIVLLGNLNTKSRDLSVQTLPNLKTVMGEVVLGGDVMLPGSFAEILAAKAGGDGLQQLLKHINQFEGIDHAVLVDQVITIGKGRLVAKFLLNFGGISHQDVADMLIEADQGEVVLEYLQNFDEIDQASLVQAMLRDGKIREVLSSIEKLPKISHDAVVLPLVAEGKVGLVGVFLPKLRLSVSAAKGLILAGELKLVSDNTSSFPDLTPDMLKAIRLAAGAA